MKLKKKFTFFVALAAMCLMVVSCKEDDKGVGEIELSSPQVTDITASTAWVSCRITGTVTPPLTGGSGFAYGPADADEVDYERIPCTVESGEAACRLTGLVPETGYKVFFYLDQQNGVHLQSRDALFTTDVLDADTPLIDVTGKKTVEAPAEGGSCTVSYQIVNPLPDGTLSVEADGITWIHSFSLAEGTLSFEVDPNDGEMREARFDMIYPKAQPVTITVSQAGVDTPPVIELRDGKTVVATAGGGDYSATYEIRYPVAGVSLQVTPSECEWVHSFDTSREGVVSFTVDANSGEERTAEFELTYTGAQPVTLTVRQQKGSSDPGPTSVVTLTRSMEWPTSYQTTTAKLGEYEYYLSNVAIYNQDNGIQFKSLSGSIANKDDMGIINRVELVYASGDSRKNFVLYAGDSEKPSATQVEAETIDGVYTYDCSAYSYRYFKLENGDGAGYLYEIRIYTGQGDTPDPVKKPSFTNLASTGISKSGATLSCDFAYEGDKTVSEAGFRYSVSGGSEQRVMTTPVPGTKSVTLNTLSSSTTYTYYFYAVVEGELYRSEAASFTTLDEQGKPTPTGTYRSGWAELPVQVDKAGDYYYAYHLRADNKNMRNYSVCYSKELGCPVWVSAPMHDCYKGGSGRTEAYGQDPDLGCTQVGRRSGYTRGHMLGSSDRTISRETNKQVFYYSNIGPQLQDGFNQGNGAWNNLESFVDGQWCADTLYQVIGCYWANKNKKVDGTVIPTHYYKVLLRTKKGNSRKWVVDCSSSELKCAAFLLEHKSQKGLKPSRNIMISVAELEQMTGFTFFANVPNAPKSEVNPSDWGL